MGTRKLIATEGKIYTNGNAYGHTIELGVNDSPDNWREISLEEYDSVIENEIAVQEAQDEY